MSTSSAAEQDVIATGKLAMERHLALPMRADTITLYDVARFSTTMSLLP